MPWTVVGRVDAAKRQFDVTATIAPPEILSPRLQGGWVILVHGLDMYEAVEEIKCFSSKMEEAGWTRGPLIAIGDEPINRRIWGAARFKR